VQVATVWSQGGGGELQISSDLGGVKDILGLKLMTSGFLGVRKLLQVLFWEVFENDN